MRKYEQIATLLARVGIFMPLLGLVFGSLVGASLLSPDAKASALVQILFPLSALIGVAWGMYSWYTGATVKAFELWMKGRLKSQLTHLLDPSEV